MKVMSNNQLLNIYGGNVKFILKFYKCFRTFLYNLLM